MSAHDIARARAAYTSFVSEGLLRGFSMAELRGQLAALFVLISGLSRAQALAAARAII